MINCAVHKFKEVTNRSRNNSVEILDFLGYLFSAFYEFHNFFRTKHAESFARATLSVGEYCAVKSFGELFHCIFCCVFVHFFLTTFYQNLVESKFTSVLFVVRPHVFKRRSYYFGFSAFPDSVVAIH